MMALFLFLRCYVHKPRMVAYRVYIGLYDTPVSTCVLPYGTSIFTLRSNAIVTWSHAGTYGFFEYSDLLRSLTHEYTNKQVKPNN